MKKGSAIVALFALTSGLAAFACGSGDSSATAADEADGGSTPTPNDTIDGAVDPIADTGPVADAGNEAGDAGQDAAPAEATAQILGYVFSGSPAATESTPIADYAFNVAGGPMTITRTGTGEYTVSFEGLALDGSIALASAYGTTGGVCYWAGSGADGVDVYCVNAAGTKADAKFSLTVIGKGTAGATILGFAHANDKTSASYTPQASRSNNAVGGGAITATRVSTGTYKMEFGGLGATDIGNAQVMPYGDEDARCVVKSWGGTTVNVYCYDTGGNLADAQYTVLIAGTKPGGTAKVVAYARADQSGSASYTPSPAYNEGDGTVTATRSAAGSYAITFDGQNLNTGAHVQVGSYALARRCNVSAWAGNAVNLTCTTAAGAKIDTTYGVVVLQ